MGGLSALSVLAGLLQLVGLARYIYKIIRKQVIPAKATWLIWTSLDTITLTGMYCKGTINGLIIGGASGALIVAIISFKYGASGWTKTDKICLGGAIVAVLSWWGLNDATFGIVISLLAMCIGTVPTLASDWKEPDNEDKLAWVIFSVSGLCAIAAIREKTLAEALQPIVFFVIDFSVLALTCLRSWTKKAT